MRSWKLACVYAFSQIAFAQPYGFYNTGGSTVSVFSTQALNETSAIPFISAIAYMAPAPDGKSLFLENTCCNSGPLTGVAQINLRTKTFPGLLNITSYTGGQMAVSPDSSKLYIAAGNSNITVFDVVTGQTSVIVDEPPQYAYFATGLVISKDGRHLYEAIQNGDFAYVSIIDTASGTVTTNVPAVGCYSLVVTPNQQFAYLATTTGIVRLNLKTGAMVNVNSVATPHIVLSPDGLRLYAISDQIVIISSPNNTVVGTIVLPGAVSYQSGEMTVSADGATGFAAYQTGQYTQAALSKIDLSSQGISMTVALNGYPATIALSSDEGSVFVGLSSPSYASAINVGKLAVAGTMEAIQPCSLAVSPDATTLYVQECIDAGVPAEPGQIIEFDARTYERTGQITLPGLTLVNIVAVTPDGQSLVVQIGEPGDYQMSLVDIATQVVTPVTPVLGYVNTAAVSPDGYLYLNNVPYGEAAGDLLKYDLSTGEQLGDLPLTVGISLIRFSPSGKRVYIPVPGGSSGQGYIAIVDSESMQQVYTIPQCGTDFAVAPDGNIWSLCFPVGSSSIYEISGRNFSVIGVFSPTSAPVGISVSPDDGQVVINESGPSYGFQVIDPGTGSTAFIQTDISFLKLYGLVFRPAYIQ